MSAIRSVLVAGIEGKGGDNHIMRFVQGHFLNVTHFPERSSTKILPILDAAIIATGGISHELQFEVKRVYESRPIFYANNGISNMKEDFEKAVYGAEIIKALRDQDVPVPQKIKFILGKFFSKGEVIDKREFIPKFGKLIGYRPSSESYWHTVFFNLCKQEITRIESRGSVEFLGLSDIHYDEMLKYGLFLEKDSKKTTEKTEILVRKSYIPPVIQNVTPIRKGEVYDIENDPESLALVRQLPEVQTLSTDSAATTIDLPTEKTPSPSSDFSAAQDLILESIAALQMKMESIEEKLLQANSNKGLDFVKMEQRLEAIIRSSGGLHKRLFDLAPKLEAMTIEDLEKFNKLLAMFHEIRV